MKRPSKAIKWLESTPNLNGVAVDKILAYIEYLESAIKISEEYAEKHRLMYIQQQEEFYRSTKPTSFYEQKD